MGMKHLQTKMQKNIELIEKQQVVQKKDQVVYKKELTKREVNIDDISEKIAIIQSTENGTLETLKVIEEIKKAIQFGVVKENEKAYWKEIKSAAQKLVEQWEAKNEELVKKEEMKYLERKLGMMGSHGNNSNEDKNNTRKNEEIKD